MRLECDTGATGALRAITRIAHILPPLALVGAHASSAAVDITCAQALSAADRASLVLHCAHIAAHQQLPTLGAAQRFFVVSPPPLLSPHRTARLQHARSLLAAALRAYVTSEDESSGMINTRDFCTCIHALLNICMTKTPLDRGTTA